MSNRIWALVVACGVASCGLTGTAWGQEQDASEEAQELYDSLFAPKVRDAMRTPDKSDDVAVAREMLSVAGQKTTPKELALILADATYKLGARDASGLDTAAEALKLIAKVDASQRDEAWQKMAVLRNRQFLSARGDDRDAAGEKLINAYFAIAFIKHAEEDKDGALVYMRRALGVANRIGSDRQEKIQEGIERITNEQRLAGRIDALKARIKNGDKKAAQNLLELYVIELDDPEEARKYTFLASDDAWKTNVSLAARNPASLDARGALTLADWYRSLASTPAGAANKAAMYTRAHQYYTFASGKGLEGTDKLKATLGLSAVDASLKSEGVDPAKIKPIRVRAKLAPPAVADTTEPDEPGTPTGPTPATAPATAPAQGKVVELLANIDIAANRVNGQWLDAPTGGVESNDYADQVLRLPANPTGDYDVAMKLTRHRKSGWAGINLPVGERAVSLILDGWGGGTCALDQIDGRSGRGNPSTVRRDTLKNNTEHFVFIRVRVRGDRATIKAEFDRQMLINWSGDIDNLSVRREYNPTGDARLALLSYGPMRFNSVRLNDLSGAAPVKGKTIDLAADWNAAQDNGRGNWNRTPTGVVSDGTQLAATCLPVRINSDAYRISLKMTRVGGAESANVFLPVGNNAAQFVLGGFANTLSGWHLSDHTPLNAMRHRKETVMRVGQPYFVTMTVRRDGNQVTLSSTMNGQPLSEWTGPLETIKESNYWPRRHPQTVMLGTYNGGWAFEDIKLTIESGNARPVRQAPQPGQPAAANPQGRSTRIIGHPKLPELGQMFPVLAQRDPALLANAATLRPVIGLNAVSLGVNGQFDRDTPAGRYADVILRGKEDVKDFIVNGALGNVPAGEYLAVYRLRHTANVEADKTMCTVELAKGGQKLADRTINFEQCPPGQWTPVGFRFNLDAPAELNARIWQNGRRVSVDRVYLFKVEKQ